MQSKEPLATILRAASKELARQHQRPADYGAKQGQERIRHRTHLRLATTGRIQLAGVPDTGPGHGNLSSTPGARICRDPRAAQRDGEASGRPRELTKQINALERELEGLVKQLGPSLLAIPGVGALGAAMILGETAGASRFKSKHAFARFNGTAPVPVWSSNKVRVRLNRGGNRTVNTALHMAAVTQTRGLGPGMAYVDKLLSEGKTRTEALRLLRRRLSDRVFSSLLTDECEYQQPVASFV
jgi:transposase